VDFISSLVRVPLFVCLAVGSMHAFASMDKEQVCEPGRLPEKLSQEQCGALVDLYNQTDGENWRYQVNWADEDNRGYWVGLGDHFGQYSLILADYNIKGPLPESFSKLLSIEYVNLSQNELSGELLDDAFTEVAEGNYINLSHNKIKSELPSSLGDVPANVEIHLHNNQFFGGIPNYIYDLAIRRVDLKLYNNNLSGAIPKPPVNLPTFGINFSFDLSHNNLSGSIPEGIFGSYESVYLDHNKLTGTVPDDIVDARRIVFINNNRLTALPESIVGLDVLIFDVSNNHIEGTLPIAGAPHRASEYNFSNNRFQGSVENFLNTVNVWRLDLSGNNLSGTLENSNLSSFWILKLNDNKLDGSLSDISRASLRRFDVSNNRLNGTVSALNPDALDHINLSRNNFSGPLPQLGSFSFAPSGVYDFSHNGFTGKVPESYLKLNRVKFDLRFNMLSGNLEDFKHRFERNSYPNWFLISNQKSYGSDVSSNVQIELLSSGSGESAVFLISIPRNKKVAEVTGCEGKLSGNLFRLHGGQHGCELFVVYEDCASHSECLQEESSTNGVKDARIESPSANKVASGVVQFRGWLHEPVIRSHKNYDVRRPRKAKLLIDDSELELDINFDRFDVAKAMGYQESNQQNLGWSALFYSGNLSNGEHTATLLSQEGAVLDTLKFESFTVLTPAGQAAYINSNGPRLEVKDFPYEGSDVILQFSRSEQAFTIVDQFDKSGESTRYEIRHFTIDDRQVRKFDSINGVDKVKIETPDADNPLLGVASIRGWAYGESILNGPLYMTIDDGEPFLIPRDSREDVENAMGINTTAKVGWSQLLYAGNLENGQHRVRILAEGSGGTLELLAQNYFESFVPLDENGERVFINSEKTVKLDDFPHPGSLVTLSFDSAGQRFVIVEQSQ